VGTGTGTRERGTIVKEIVITTQAELDALPTSFDEYTKVIIRSATTSRLVVRLARENSSVEAWENSSVEAWGNSSVVARGNSSVEAWENSSVEAWGNSSVEAWGNSSVEAWGNSSVVARGNSSVVARENSSVVARENSSVVAWENVVVRIFSDCVKKVVLYGFAVAIIAATLTVNIEKKSEHCHIQVTKELGWFERNAVEQTPTVTLYKRVSKDLKTQENTANETTWTIGTTLTVPNWNTDSECGPGRFHACSRPYFCDEFRSKQGDRYIAVSIKLEDLHEWKDSPSYPHKIAFRMGKVLYECDKFGKELKK
jgi:hypothetical protein